MIARLIKATVSAPPAAALLSAARGSSVCVLTYHRINVGDAVFPGLDVDIFRAQMRWLSQRCQLLRPQELASALRQGRSTKPRVLVTFDDGYRDFHDVAFPILSELRIPALVFLATSFIGSREMIWTD